VVHLPRATPITICQTVLTKLAMEIRRVQVTIHAGVWESGFLLTQEMSHQLRRRPAKARLFVQPMLLCMTLMQNTMVRTR